MEETANAMLCDVAIYGEWAVEERSVEDFLSAEVRRTLPPGFPAESLDQPARTVEAALEELTSWQVMAPEYLSIHFEQNRFAIRALVSKETFLVLAPEIVSLCRTAAAFGGSGEMSILGIEQLRFGYAMRGSKSRFAIRTLRNEQIDEMRASDFVTQLREDSQGSMRHLLNSAATSSFLLAGARPL